jgi:hypothetical protein
MPGISTEHLAEQIEQTNRRLADEVHALGDRIDQADRRMYHLIELKYCLRCGNTIVICTSFPGGDDGPQVECVVHDHYAPQPFVAANPWSLIESQAAKIRRLQEELTRRRTEEG